MSAWSDAEDRERRAEHDIRLAAWLAERRGDVRDERIAELEAEVERLTREREEDRRAFGFAFDRVRRLLCERDEARAEVDRLRGLLVPILRAWADMGPAPDYHIQQRREVRRRMPVLGAAIERAVDLYADPKEKTR